MKLEFTLWEGNENYRSGINVPTLIINDKLYLQPFRYYRMQVSESINQFGSAGDSEVMGLLRMVLFDDLIKNIDIDSNIDGYQTNVPFLEGIIDQLSSVALYRCEDLTKEDVITIRRSKVYDKFIEETLVYLRARSNELKANVFDIMRKSGWIKLF